MNSSKLYLGVLLCLCVTIALDGIIFAHRARTNLNQIEQ